MDLPPITLQEVQVDGEFDLPRVIQALRNERRFDKTALLHILSTTRDFLTSEPNLLTVPSPCVIFGDLHGQFYDLVNIVVDYIDSPATHMLFLGDYVDRGYFGCEVCLFLFILKITRPTTIHLLRGNHECRLLTTFFNFRSECVFKYDEDIYFEFMRTFDALPLCALLQSDLGKFFCVHGGISPTIRYIDEINRINRFREPPGKGPFCDLLWADPLDEAIFPKLSAKLKEDWLNTVFVENKVRGCSYCYGFNSVKKFLDDNKLTSIIRAHEVQKDGCHLHYFMRDDLNHPLVMTLFTAPNYCDVYENDGAILVLLDNELSFLSYNAVPHPFWLPKFQTGIEYSLPVIGDLLNEAAKRLRAVSSTDDDTAQPEPTKKDAESLDVEEEFLVPLDVDNSQLPMLINRRRSFVHHTSQQVSPHSRPRYSTFSLKGQFEDSTHRFTFSITPSPRFEMARQQDLENERLPANVDELRKMWNIE